MPSFKIIDLLVLEKKILKGFAIYSHGDYLGHVNLIIHIHFHSPFLRMLHTKFGFVSEKKIFEYYGNMHVYCPGVGADLPLGYIYFQNHK